MKRAWTLVIPALVAACEVPNDGLVETEGSLACDGLDESSCMFPFPSDYYRDADTGFLKLHEDALPISQQGQMMEGDLFNKSDGYSPLTPIYFQLEGATLDGAPAYDSIGRSLEKSARTLIVDAQTGELAPHWAEWDHFALDSGEKIVALRIANRLKYGRRYIVAVQGLVDEDGKTLEPERGFKALRDGSGSIVKGVHARRERFEKDVFAPLKKAGIDRSKLQLAFDFTTATEDNSIGAMLSMREEVLQHIGEEGPEYEVTKVETFDAGPIAIMVTGIAKVPSYLTGTPGKAQPLRRDASGKPVAEGFEDVEFQVQIPRSALTSQEPAAIMKYGHGLLGRKAEAHNSWLREMANRYNFVVIAADLQGMATEDELIWANVLVEDMSNLPLLAEKPHQGVMNYMALVRMMKGRFFKDTDPRFTKEGTPYYDPERFYYYGNSQGGTMGALHMSLQPDIERGVLGVPGGAFSFLLTRAAIFEDFAVPIRSSYLEARDFLTIMGLVQIGFNKLEPMNFASRITENPYPGLKPHRVLLQVAREDAQVHNEVSHLLGRVVGAKLLEPALRPIWGLESAQSPYAGNAIVEYDYGVPDTGKPNYPSIRETDTHSHTRKQIEAQDQLWHFLTSGESKNFCSGSCDPD